MISVRTEACNSSNNTGTEFLGFSRSELPDQPLASSENEPQAALKSDKFNQLYRNNICLPIESCDEFC